MTGINMVINSLFTMLQNLEVNDPKSSELFTVGDKLQAQVIAREGDSFLLQSGSRLFRAQSELNLVAGEKLLLLVTEQKDGRTTLKLQVQEGYNRPEHDRSTGQLLKDSGILDLTINRSDIGSNIKGGQYLQAQVKVASGDLMLINTKEGAFTIKLTNPLPAGTEITMSALNNSGENGEVEVQLWQMTSNLTNSSVEGKTTILNADSHIADTQSSKVLQPVAPNLDLQAADTQNIHTQVNDSQASIVLGKPIMAKLILESGAGFLPGTIFTATVKDKATQYYRIEIEGKQYFVESDSELPLGEKLQLITKETVDNKIKLQYLPPQQNKQDHPIEKVRALVAKYGFQGEKELYQLAEKLAQLPVDPQTGVRYLLDPHLATAVIIPAPQKDLENTKIEIKEYQESQRGQRVWELSLDLNLAQLGSLEIVLKLIDNKIYTRIWAKEPSTEALLREKQRELSQISTILEIVPVAAGPLIPKEPAENIDLKV